jgi:hypothetical protein
VIQGGQAGLGGGGGDGQSDNYFLSPNGGGGDGSVGGAGLSFAGTGDSLIISSSGVLTGGQGGRGGEGATKFGGPGGTSGTGVAFAADRGTLSNAGAITGGRGGDIGVDGSVGGDGRAGVAFAAQGTLSNSGSITGGADRVGKSGAGGAGGAGVAFAARGTLGNSGSISGGAGGETGAYGEPAGAGGVGVLGSGLTLVDSGAISGGLNGDGVTRADAVRFTGGVNSLTLEAGFAITGHVVAYSRADTLALGGDASATFDASAIGAQYLGFGVYQKTGASTWTLTGATTVDTSWALVAGALDVAALGAAGTGAIAFAAGAQTLKIENAALDANSFANTIRDFGQGDVIDLTGLTFKTGATVSYDAHTNLLTVMSGGVAETLRLASPGGGDFVVSDDGAHGTQVTLRSAPAVKIASIWEGPSAGATLGVGARFTIVVNMNVAISAGGSGKFATLALNDGGVAIFNPSKSAGTTFAFDFTVKASDNTPAGQTLAVTAVHLNGNIVRLNGQVIAPDLTVPAVQTGPVIDTVDPSIVSITETPPHASLLAWAIRWSSSSTPARR